MLDIDGNSDIDGSKIDNKIVNLSNNIKKMSFRARFFTSKASLVFTQLKKTFTKALILYYFNLVHYIQSKTNTLDYIINGILCQLTTKRKLADQVIYKINLVNSQSEMN